MTQPRNLGAFADNLNTSGQVSLTTGVSGTLPVANGGTGQTSLTCVTAGKATNLAGGGAGYVPYQSGSGATAFVSAGTSGQYLKSNGTSAPTWSCVSASTANVQTFTTSGTWTKPSGITFVQVCVFGAGGGGGSGARCGGSSNYIFGGSGGGGGAHTQYLFKATQLPSTVSVTVGSSGCGGASRSTNGNGYNGSTGGYSSFGTYLYAYGGGGGAGGRACSCQCFVRIAGASGGGSVSSGATPSTYRSNVAGGKPSTNIFGSASRYNNTLNTQNAIGTAGAGSIWCSGPGNAEYGGAAGAQVCGWNGQCGASSIFGGPGGGGGGGSWSGNTGAGGAGGKVGSYCLGGGGAGSAKCTGNAAVNTNTCNTGRYTVNGGGGGGGSSASNGGNGGNAGASSGASGGGGGGGGAYNHNSGAGGNGAPGLVVVSSW